MSAKAGRSRSNSAWPASVSATLRVVRFRSLVPRRASSPRMAWLRAEGDRPRRTEARRKLSASATATKLARSAYSALRTTVVSGSPSHADHSGLSIRSPPPICGLDIRWSRPCPPLPETYSAAGPQRLHGKVALVTGAGSGIGRAAALKFAREGAAVVLAGRRPAELDAAASEIVAAGGRAAAIPTDVSDEAAVDRLISGAVERFGRLDVAFNNAGVTAYSPIDQLTADDFDRVMATNVRGVWLLIKAEVETLRRQGQGGVIVNTSSIAATGGSVGLSVYAASKGALDAMIRAVALEVGGDGVRINNVSPGVIRTPMTAVLPEEALGPIAAHAALKRVGEPEDVADVAVWLCTQEARFVTGQSLLVDGGFNIAGAR